MTADEQDRKLARIAEATRYLLLDFDGPVCKIFTDPSSREVTSRLVEVIHAHGVEAPEHVREDGPHDVLRFAGTVSPQLARVVDQELRAIEVKAAETATPTPGAAELLEACQRTGRPVAIVSNNAAEAITAYLKRLDLAELVTHVEGRDPDDPSLMKPSPYLIDQARVAFDATAGECTLVGDSTTDTEAAQAAGVHSVAYANKPGKFEKLKYADEIISRLGTLTTDISTHPNVY